MRLQECYSNSLKDKGYSLQEHHFLLSQDKFLQDKGIQFRTECQEGNKNRKDNLKKQKYHFSHNTCLRGIKYNWFDLKLAGSNQDRKDTELLSLLDKNIRVHISKKQDLQHLILQDNNNQLNSFLNQE